MSSVGPDVGPSLRAAILSPRCAVMAALGFASGLPYAIATDTSHVLLADLGVDTKTLGWIGAISTIYAFKFLWSPLVDAKSVPLIAQLGRRRSWLAATQLALVAVIAFVALVVPASKEASLAGFALAIVAIAIVSATQDIVVNAWTVDVFPKRELGIGSAMSVWGYRAALLVGGAAAPVIAAKTNWSIALATVAALMGVGLIATLSAREPNVEPEPQQPTGTALVAPVRELFARLDASIFVVFALVLLFRLPDQLAAVMQKSLLITTLHYSVDQYAILRNGVGVGATLVGALLGGVVVARFGMLRALLLGGAIGALSNLGFAWIATVVEPLQGGAQPWLSSPMRALVVVAVIENLSGGFVATAFVAYLMSLCQRRHAATQYALLSGAMALAGGGANAASGYMASAMTWPAFFVVTALAGLPGLALVPLAIRRARPAPD